MRVHVIQAGEIIIPDTALFHEIVASPTQGKVELLSIFSILLVVFKLSIIDNVVRLQSGTGKRKRSSWRLSNLATMSSNGFSGRRGRELVGGVEELGMVGVAHIKEHDFAEGHGGWELVLVE